MLYGSIVHYYTCISADWQSAAYDRTDLLALLQAKQWELRLRRCSKRPPCAGSGRSLGGLPAVVLCAAALPGWRLLLGLLLLCLLTTAAAAAAAVPVLTPTRDQGAE